MTHQSDAEIRKDLYKLNKLTEVVMTENLIVLLEDDNPSRAGNSFFQMKMNYLKNCGAKSQHNRLLLQQMNKYS